ncbi:PLASMODESMATA CALLOSE-BINDING PROTEIN 5 isoform X1 [Brachypodium distachyon]|uniref:PLASMODESMATA CALLOSE-BINDING PROTEIN 5 isoform X1 n=1 Tax=Brachypodium distachyon TaxID=15368 RepID=UPI00052FF8F1|nr:PLASMODESMATA CALLOSE-BINDING PROTEIN 5 isoform X1 [Brachypodium distachyon]|eukprot:XP_010227649.1 PLASMODESMATA CALLOSE-BINDING PROTEIN 5 isoform X1 [Brachypodium distachyon]
MVAASPPLLHLALPLLLFAAHAAVGSAAGAVAVSSGGQLWCVAKNNAEDGALQSAIDWACGPNGGADCRAIQLGGACYEPPDLLAHASYAFNDYFLRSGGAANPASCDFSGAAALIGLNPSHGNCVFPSSASPKNGSFTGTTSYGQNAADLSESSSCQLNLWSLLLCMSISVTILVVLHF